ncbi:MAG: hypothetical protein Q8K30_05765 [Candidatus Gracilibacteria bacterium]|nr:hypothetical protein [Candidatus Gracilibacteria bacterium]
MLNKIFSFLIIIGVFVGGYFYYNYKYIPEQNMKIQAQVKEEEQKKIEIEQTKKALKLSKIDVKIIELTNEQKIQQIKDDKSNYKTFNLKNASKVYFREMDNKLDLYVDNVKIGNFNLVYPGLLRVNEVLGSLNDLYIEIGNNKFYYNSLSGLIIGIDLNIDIKYVKKGSINELIFVTSMGSFTYSILDKKLEYFTYFNDFVYYSDFYIGLVKKDDTRILKNLGFEADSDLIVLYNPNTKEKKILYKLLEKIDYIYVQNEILYLYDIEGNIYELENIASNL